MPDPLVFTPSIEVTSAERPHFACTWRAVGTEACWVQARGELDIAMVSVFERTLDDAQTHARLVVLDL